MGRIYLSPQDRKLAEEFRYGDYKVINDVRPSEYKEPNGHVIVVPCADGHQVLDISTFQASFTKTAEPMVHTLGLNGGPLLLAPSTPLLRQGERDDDVLIKHISQACAIKGTPTILLYAHAPCGAAQAAGLNLVQVIELLLAAKQRVKQMIPGMQIIPGCHVDWAEPNGKAHKRSYYVSRAAFEQWKYARCSS